MIIFKHPVTIMPILIQQPPRMFSAFVRRVLPLVVFSLILTLPLIGQSVGAVEYRSQELSEVEGIPVLIKHLPDWETAQKRAIFATNLEKLKDALGERPILDDIDFSVGTEAVTAPYDDGKLLIVEYTSPQGSVEADNLFSARLSQTGDQGTVYRRIGNYNVFVFDAVDPAAANALIDQVKYEKQIHWLGDNPFHISAERAFVLTTADLFLSTVMIIVIGICLSIFGGIIAGYIFYYAREHKRAQFATFSDAGGMTRLNLDGYTPDILPERLLKD
jgi:hypothetical protein